MKILVVSQYRDIRMGGAERYLFEVCSRLEKEPDLRLNYLASDIRSAREISAPNIRFLTTSFNFSWPGETLRLLERMRPDAIYAHYTVPGLCDAALFNARRLNIPTTIMHHSDVTGDSPLKRLVGEAHYRLSGGRSLASCAAIFVNSRRHVAASPFLRRIDAEYIEAPPGVDPGMAEAPFSPKKPYLLFVGKLDVAGKGWDVLLRAWRILRERRPDLELTAAGAPPADAIRERGVTCTGFIHSREKLAGLYASAAVTVLPSVIPESFGMALAEALIAGCPIVGSDIGGIPAVIEEGVNGYLAPAGDAEGLAAAMERALENGRELRRTILKNREAYMHRYNWDRTARIVAATLRRIGGEGGSMERRS